MIYAVIIEGIMIACLLVGVLHARGLGLIAHIRINEVYAYVVEQRAAEDFTRKKLAENTTEIWHYDPDNTDPFRGLQVTGSGDQYTTIETVAQKAA